MAWELASHSYTSHAQTQAAYNTALGAMLDTFAAGLVGWSKVGVANYNDSAAGAFCVFGVLRHTGGAEIGFQINHNVGGGYGVEASNHYDGTTLTGSEQANAFAVAFKPVKGGGSFGTPSATQNPRTPTTLCADAGAFLFALFSASNQYAANHKIHMLWDGTTAIILWENTVGTISQVAIFSEAGISVFYNAGDTDGRMQLVWASTFEPGVNQPAGQGVINRNSTANVTTVGSNTTVTLDATDYAAVSTGDVITANSLSRVITAKPGSPNVTVNTAVDWDNGGAGYAAKFGLRVTALLLEGRNTFLTSTVNPSSPWIWENLVAWRSASGQLKGLVDPTNVLRRVGTHVPARQQLDAGNYVNVGNGLVVPWGPAFGPIP